MAEATVRRMPETADAGACGQEHAEQQDTHPEWTTSASESPPKTPAAPAPLTFQEELQRRLSRRAGGPPPALESSESAASPVKCSTEQVDTEMTVTSSPIKAPAAPAVPEKRPPPPPPQQRQARPPPLPNLPKPGPEPARPSTPQRSQVVPPAGPPLPIASAASAVSSFCNSEASTPRAGSFARSVCSNAPSAAQPMTEVVRTSSPAGSFCRQMVVEQDRDHRSGHHPTEQRGQMYTTWQSKSLGDELQMTRGELSEVRRRAACLEDEVRALQKENIRLRQQLDIQNDRDDLLRDIRNRVSEAEIFQEPMGFRQKRGLCGSICSLFGRKCSV